MDESKLRWITAIVILIVGTGYMVWLLLTYVRFQATDTYVRQTLADYLKGTPANEPNPE